MVTLLNIALVVVGSTATLAAFGGKTWNEGRESIWLRITARGWLSLLCWLLALSLGVLKEAVSQSEQVRRDQDAKKEAAQTKTEADRRQAGLTMQLKLTQDQLGRATQKITELEGDNKSIKGQLDDSKSVLTSTRLSLEKASTSNLISALTTHGVTVQEIWVVLPLLGTVDNENGYFDSVRSAILAGLNQSSCPSAELVERIQGIGNDPLFEFHDWRNDGRGRSFAGQTPGSKFYDLVGLYAPYGQDQELLQKEFGEYAGEFLVLLYLPGPDQRLRADAFVADAFESSDVLDFATGFYPCHRAEIKNGKSPVFQKASLILVLDRDRQETISITLKGLPFKNAGSGIVTLQFASESGPYFMSRTFWNLMKDWRPEMEYLPAAH